MNFDFSYLDIAFKNGSVITVNEKDEIAEAVGVKGNNSVAFDVKTTLLKECDLVESGSTHRFMAWNKNANEGRGGERRASTPEERFALLKELASAYMSAEDVAMLEKAFRFASEAHAGQCRKSGEPFVAHPVEVAIILVDLRMDVETLIVFLSAYIDFIKKIKSEKN